jgi:hypothetical protein
MEKQLEQPYQRPGNRGRTFIPATVFSFGLLLACSTLSASPHQQSLKVTAAADFDSNAEMLETDEKAVWRAIFTPDYKFRWVQAENELLAQARLNIERSSDTQLSVDREDPLLSLQWTAADPKGELRLEGSFEESSTRVSEFEDTGQVFTDDTRTEWALDAGWDRSLTVRTQLGFSAGYSDVSYDGDSFTDFVLVNTALQLTYLASERSTPYIQLTASRYEPDDPKKPERPKEDVSKRYGLTAGVSWQLNSIVETEIHVGASQIDKDNRTTDPVGGASLKFTGERLRTRLEYKRSVAASGSGGFIKADNARGSVSYAYSAVTNFGSSVSWRKNLDPDPVFGNENGDENENENTTAELWADRKLAERWYVRASWQFKQQKSEFDSEAHIVNVSMRYDLPEF